MTGFGPRLGASLLRAQRGTRPSARGTRPLYQMSALQRDFLLWKCMCGVYVKHNDALGVTVVLTCAVAGEVVKPQHS